MPEITPDRLRITFDEVAELYDRVRPGYPAELFDDLASITGLGPGARVLEIGPGTGQATRPLAERHYDITAVEIGPNLAALARSKLAAFPNVTINVAAFEDWPLPAEPFDAVVSASAFHWLDAKVAVNKVAAALRPGGSLAVIGTHHIDGGTTPFFIDAQVCYERWTKAPPGFRLPAAADVPREEGAEVLRRDAFDPAVFRRYEWEREYSTADYVGLQSTYSEIRALEERTRESLQECIASLIDGQYGGQIRKRHLNQLMIARRRAAGPRLDRA